MKLLNELAASGHRPLPCMAQVQALFEQQQAKLTQRDAVLAEKDFKITALTHELAYYRRVRFGKASEALVGEQRMLFDETVDMDLAAIEEELESQCTCQASAQARRPPAAAAGVAAHRAPPRAGIMPVRPMRRRPGQDRRRRQRTAGRGTCALLRASPYPPAVRLPSLRDGDGGADPAGRHRRRHGRRWPAGLDRGMQVPGSFAAVPHRADRGARGRAAGPLHAGRMDRAHRRGLAAAGRPAGRTAQATKLPACRRNTGAPARSRQRQDQTRLSVGLPVQCARRWAVDGRVRLPDQPCGCARARLPAGLARASDGRRLLGLQGAVCSRPDRACLPGPHPAQVLRRACRQRQPGGRGGAAAHCAAVRYRTTRRRA